MVLTVFIPETVSDKLPISEDDTFNFVNIDVPLKEISNVFKNHFVLSRALLKSGTFKRDGVTLSPLYNEDQGYILFDIDKVSSKESFYNIIKWFRMNEWGCSIFPSQSFNGEDNFNCKVICRINFKSTKVNLQKCLLFVQDNIGEYCLVDPASIREASYQAPSYTDFQLHLNESDNAIQYSAVEEYVVQETVPDELFCCNVEDHPTLWAQKHIKEVLKGKLKSSQNSNGSYSLTLPCEIKSKYSYFWFPNSPLIIHHPQKNKSILLYNEYLKTDEGETFLENYMMSKMKDYFTFNTSDTSLYLEIDEKYFPKSEEISSCVDNFIREKDVLLVKGIMGSGKSNVISQFISKKPSKVLFISVRRSLAQDISEKYKVKSYLTSLSKQSSDKYKYGESLVCQIDSIHKLNMAAFDYVVIDEFESLLIYVFNQIKHSDYFLAVLRNLKEIFDNKKLIILDAFINKFSMNLFFSDKKVNLINNVYKDDNEPILYKNKNSFFLTLEELAVSREENEILSMSFSTLNELFATKNLLINRGLRVVDICSETLELTREKLMELIKFDDNTLYDVILFSPSITVGISILNNIKHHFHFDNGKSIDAISSVQMLKRSRKAKNIHMYIEGRHDYSLPLSLELLNKEIEDNRNSFPSLVDMDESISQMGVFFNKFNLYYNWLRVDHKVSFKLLLSQQFKETFYIDKISSVSSISKYLKEITDKKKESKNIFKNYTLPIPIEDMQTINNSDKREQILIDIKKSFPFLDDEYCFDIAKEYVKDESFIKHIEYFLLYLEDDIFKKKLLDDMLIKTPIISTFVGEKIKLLSFLLFLNKDHKFRLQDKYSQEDIKKFTKQYFYNNLSFRQFLNLIGYKNISNRLSLPYSLKRIISKILEVKKKYKEV